MHVVKAMQHGPSKAVFSVILNRRQCRKAVLQVLQDFPGPVRAAVVDHDNFVGHASKTQLDIQMLEG
jgi:hypothetical protein